MDTPTTMRLNIISRQKEIEQLLAQAPVDRLAIEELMSANQRDMRVLTSAQNLICAAPRRPSNAFIPHAFARS